ncbi:hypothetical protein Tco_1124004 [Tanacetum coccineum]|uniref:Uncharacterized protein n=1 Tax=Tanacetum coccineum TaxID=301880 RepID=A0ABQ5J8T5_9ASTR
MITTSSKIEGRKPSGLIETVDIMDLIPCVRSVHYITQDLALLGVKIVTMCPPWHCWQLSGSSGALNGLGNGGEFPPCRAFPYREVWVGCIHEKLAQDFWTVLKYGYNRLPGAPRVPVLPVTPSLIIA